MKVEAIPTRDPQEPQDGTTVRSIDAFFDEVHGRFSWRSLLQRHRYWLLVFAVAFSMTSDSLDYGMMRFVVADDRFQRTMIHENFRLGSYAFVAVSAGAFSGKVLSGLFVDHPSPRLGGRRRAFLFGLTSSLVGTVGTALSTSMVSLVLFQYLSGVGASTTYTAASLLLVEMFPPSYRGSYSAASEFFWAIGNVCGSLNAMFVLQADNDDNHEEVSGIYNFTESEGADDHLSGILNATGTVNTDIGTRPAAWRYFSLLTAIPSLVCLILALLLVPESARYLALAGRYEEATQVANYIARAMAGTAGSAGGSLSTDGPLQQPQMNYRPLSVDEIRHTYESNDGKTLGDGGKSLLATQQDANGTRFRQPGEPSLQNHIRNQEEELEEENESIGNRTTSTPITNTSSRSSSLLSSVFGGFLAPFRHGTEVRYRTIALLVAHVSLALPGRVGVGFTFAILRKALTSKVLSHDAFALSLLTTLVTLGTQGMCLFTIDRFSRRCLVISALAILAFGTFLFAAGVAHDRPFDLTADEDEEEEAPQQEPSSRRNLAADFIVILGLCLGTMGQAATGTSLYLWTRELIPTAIRGTVVSTTIGGSKEIAFILANAVSGLMMQAGWPVFMIALGAVGPCMAIAPALMLPDTRGKALADGTTTLSTEVPVPVTITNENEPEAGGSGTTDPNDQPVVPNGEPTVFSPTGKHSELELTNLKEESKTGGDSPQLV